MATGLHEILSDVDVVYGLLLDAAKGEIHIFLEATKSVDGVGENENGADGDDEAGDDDENDTDGENSVAGEFVNMNSDNDDHGTIIGSILKKRKECNVFDDFDEEVDHTNIIRPDRVDKNVNGDGEYARLDHNLEVDPHSPISIYRNSSDSEHIAPNLSDEDSIHPVDQQPFHNGKGDYENIQLVSGMKFQSAHKFKEVIVNHSISIGADIIWKKSCKTKMEAICREKCGWRVYASWHGKKEAFMLKTVGKPHSCARKLRNKQATSKWIANTFLERFRLNPNWDVKQMIVELNINHALEGEIKGMLLSAVGKDGNNQMYPIAWAVVEGENRSAWTWFIHILAEELNMVDGTGWIVISDQQKLGARSGDTPTSVVNREIRNAMSGVGLYVAPHTGNEYFM
ncbi:hypothetical protein LINPERHAP2_LOCUS25815, partial [Linum perenne]